MIVVFAMRLRRGERMKPVFWSWVVGSLLLVTAIGAVVKAAQHPPGAITTARCAGTPSGGTPSDPSVGLSEWTVFEGSAEHNLVLDGNAATSGLLASWTFRPNGEIGMAPTVVGGIAYVTSLDHCIYALDVATGRQIWSFHSNNMVMSEPLVVAGRVLFGSGNKTVTQAANGDVLRGTGASTLYALNAATGRQLWAVNTKGENMPTMLYDNGTVYAADGSGTMTAIGAATGAVHWTVNIGSVDSMSSPDISGNIAVFGGADPFAFYGVNLQTGQILWTVPVANAMGGIDDLSPTISGETAYVQVPAGTYPDAKVIEMALNVQTGQVLWQTILGQGTMPESDKEETGVATLTGGALYVGSPALNAVFALDAASGTPLWSATIPSGIAASPTVDAGNILVMDEQGDLDVLATSNGQLLQSIRVGVWVSGIGECTSPAPLIVGKTVFFASGADAALVAEPLANILAGKGLAVAGISASATSGLMPS